MDHTGCHQLNVFRLQNNVVKSANPTSKSFAGVNPRAYPSLLSRGFLALGAGTALRTRAMFEVGAAAVVAVDDAGACSVSRGGGA